jgi:hypothetical protein
VGVHDAVRHERTQEVVHVVVAPCTKQCMPIVSKPQTCTFRATADIDQLEKKQIV